MTRDRRLTEDLFRTDRDRMSHDEALALIADRVTRVADDERVGLRAALGRVLAETVVAPRDVPLADNSAVDGYGFAAACLPATGGFLPVVGRVPAGHPRSEPVPLGAAVRIFTGAALPPGVDTVAMQEDCETHAQDGVDYVIVPALQPGANRRRAGEDLAAGSVVMREGDRLRPQDVAGLASLGQAEVWVRRRLRVALLSTGDEIRRPGQAIAPGEVYDSNGALLTALLSAGGADVTDLGVLPDRRDAIREAIRTAAADHDAILTTGGASRGEEDHVVAALDEIGRRHLWQIAMKPGHPMTFGQVGDCVFLGLPGNPVAAFVCFLLYGRPVLDRLEGATRIEPARLRLPAAFTLTRRRTDRREFLRGRLAVGPDGAPAVEKFPRDGSALITSLREADGLIEIPEGLDAVDPGDPVGFIPFAAFGLT